ncbi:MAG: prolyl oligopeptidase family serine peptidase [Burkholderiaceae bacterium]|nr:prolyl oligopeptidase family serine peptidase [Burkholderiaceae bacterium]
MRRARKATRIALAAGAAFALAACGGGSSTQSANTAVAEGALIYNPPLRVGSVTAAAFTASLTSQAATSSAAAQLLTVLTGGHLLPLPCGVDFYYIQYYTVGGAGESTTASGALMVPTGVPLLCSGKRPIVMYAHGTSVEHSYNLANPNDSSNPASAESSLIATIFAAQGYIVVAPNYAGYDTSSLPYHPWLNADQQSQEMIDALAAARSALGKIPTAGTLDNGQLFLTGYSQGGHVAMATLRKMQAKSMPVTAAAPMSGPYAMEAFVDAVIFGKPFIFSTLFMPLLPISYQHAYHNVYNATTDVFSPTYATGIDTLLPTNLTETQLITEGKLPQSALLDSTTPVTGNATLDAQLAVPSNPLFAAGFGHPSLINNSFRLQYALDVVASPDGALASSPPPAGAPLAANPSFPTRKDIQLNDMRDPLWVPSAPTLMCGGGEDPTVFFLNTQVMQAFWQPLNLPTGLVTALDVDLTTANAGDSPLPFVPIQTAFTGTWNALLTAQGQQKALEQYHETVAPFCMLAAFGFFHNF